MIAHAMPRRTGRTRQTALPTTEAERFASRVAILFEHRRFENLRNLVCEMQLRAIELDRPSREIIADLDLSAILPDLRLVSILGYHGIHLVRQLAERTEESLSSIHDVGPKRVAMIRTALGKLGIMWPRQPASDSR